MSEHQVVIHVRFAPDGSVTEIGERPENKSAQVWFNQLSDDAAFKYEALSGGRGIFKLSRADVDALKAKTVH
jgi:hypothetical protein